MARTADLNYLAAFGLEGPCPRLVIAWSCLVSDTSWDLQPAAHKPLSQQVLVWAGRSQDVPISCDFLPSLLGICGRSAPDRTHINCSLSAISDREVNTWMQIAP